MRTVRLLPVVVAATSALLVLKTLGLATGGGYVLPASAAAGPGAPPAAPMALGPTLEDPAPVLPDSQPTLAATAATAQAGEEGSAPAPADPGDSSPAPAAGTDPEIERSCVVVTDDSTAPEAVDCATIVDGQPMQIGPDGQTVPLAGLETGVLTEDVLLERLAERRTALDAYAAELEMREALIAAAEQRIENRAATMEALEAEIAGLVEEKSAARENLVGSVVAMYESMRPRDAAAIFNALDLDVLEQVARAMPPRKMAPILAAMSPTRAQELTVRLAMPEGGGPPASTIGALSDLPQIVGQ